jgi:hypothetical protein
MTWEEATDNVEFNIAGILSLVITFVINILNGTLLEGTLNLKLLQMNFHDTITIILSILSGVFVIVKIANGILTFISKREELKDKLKSKKTSQNKTNEPSKNS